MRQEAQQAAQWLLSRVLSCKEHSPPIRWRGGGCTVAGSSHLPLGTEKAGAGGEAAAHFIPQMSLMMLPEGEIPAPSRILLTSPYFTWGPT